MFVLKHYADEGKTRRNCAMISKFFK